MIRQLYFCRNSEFGKYFMMLINIDILINYNVLIKTNKRVFALVNELRIINKKAATTFMMKNNDIKLQ